MLGDVFGGFLGGLGAAEAGETVTPAHALLVLADH